MFIRKLAVVVATAAVVAYGPLQASALTISGPAHTLQSNQLRPPMPPCRGPYTQEWVETSTNPVQYKLEEVARYCTPIIVYTCPAGTSLFVCELLALPPMHQTNLNNISAKAMGGGQICKPCIIEPAGPNGSQVVDLGRRMQGGVNEFGLGSDTAGSVVADAVDGKRQLLFASTSNTTGTAGILVYSGNNTNPTAFLTDKAAGPLAGGIAIDKKGDIFWAFDDESGSGHIDEFGPGGVGQRMFNIEIGGSAGDLEVDAHGNLIVASPSTNSVLVYNAKGQRLAEFTTTGSPNSLSLDAKNQNLYLIDLTNNLIDQYAYPSGTLVASNPPDAIDGQVPVVDTITTSDAEAE